MYIVTQSGHEKLLKFSTMISWLFTKWPIVSAPGDCDDGEFGGITICRGNRSTGRKPAPAPLCPPQIPLDETQARTLAAAVGSQRLTA
jgi:hypothetical protein